VYNYPKNVLGVVGMQTPKMILTLAAVAIALFMQTGLCPKCIFDDCGKAQAATPQAPEKKSCCSASSSDDITQISDVILPVDPAACPGCNPAHFSSCFTVEVDLLANVLSVDVTPDLQRLTDSLIPDSHHVELSTAEQISARQFSDLPPPDILRAITTTELLL